PPPHAGPAVPAAAPPLIRPSSAVIHTSPTRANHPAHPAHSQPRVKPDPAGIAHPELYALFFFQADDGIRDLTVTGVQTCALPISLPLQLTPLPATPQPSTAPCSPKTSAPPPWRSESSPCTAPRSR